MKPKRTDLLIKEIKEALKNKGNTVSKDELIEILRDSVLPKLESFVYLTSLWSL